MFFQVKKFGKILYIFLNYIGSGKTCFIKVVYPVSNLLLICVMNNEQTWLSFSNFERNKWLSQSQGDVVMLSVLPKALTSSTLLLYINSTPYDQLKKNQIVVMVISIYLAICNRHGSCNRNIFLFRIVFL